MCKVHTNVLHLGTSSGQYIQSVGLVEGSTKTASQSDPEGPATTYSQQGTSEELKEVNSGII